MAFFSQSTYDADTTSPSTPIFAQISKNELTVSKPHKKEFNHSDAMATAVGATTLSNAYTILT
jgi:hypothetical protein